MAFVRFFKKRRPLIILFFFLIASFSADAVAQARGGWLANQSLMRQNQMMQQQRMAQQRQAAMAAQRQRQLALQRQQLERQRAVQAQRQRAQQAMQKRRQAVANQRAAIQKRQQAIQQQRLNAIKSRQSKTSAAAVPRPNTRVIRNNALRNNATQSRTLRQQKIAKDRTERLRRLRLQREKQKLDKEKKERKDREEKREQQDSKRNDTNLSLASLANRSRTITSQPINRPNNVSTFKQIRQSTTPNTRFINQRLIEQRIYAQTRAKQLKKISERGQTTKKKTTSQTRQNTQNKAAKYFGACDSKTKKCTCSFHGETGVITSNGIQKIRDITAGDTLVWSKNDKTGESSWQPVLEHYSNQYESQVHIELVSAANDKSHTIISNQIHPFFVAQTGLRPVSSVDGMVQAGKWVQAQDLRQGDTLLSATNKIVEIKQISLVPRAFEAFNLTVKNNNTYFISPNISTEISTVWVHNDCRNNISNVTDTKKSSVSVAALSTSTTARWSVNNYRIGGKMTAIEHINYRHAHTSGFSNVSKFGKGTSVREIRSYVDNAIRNGRKIPNGKNGYKVELDLNKNIGTKSNGQISSKIRVYVRDGNIQTAFPI